MLQLQNMDETFFKHHLWCLKKVEMKDQICSMI